MGTKLLSYHWMELALSSYFNPFTLWLALTQNILLTLSSQDRGLRISQCVVRSLGLLENLLSFLLTPLQAPSFNLESSGMGILWAHRFKLIHAHLTRLVLLMSTKTSNLSRSQSFTALSTTQLLRFLISMRFQAMCQSKARASTRSNCLSTLGLELIVQATNYMQEDFFFREEEFLIRRCSSLNATPKVSSWQETHLLKTAGSEDWWLLK